MQAVNQPKRSGPTFVFGSNLFHLMPPFLPYALSAFLAFGLIVLRYRRRQRPAASPDALTSHLIPAHTTHCRLLPTPSRHTFTYPLLYVGVDIDSLESGSLDLPMRLHVYGGSPITKILGLRSDGYLGTGKATFRSKLDVLLSEHGCKRSEMGRVWLVTMPSFIGWEGINPLSIWYCYGKVKDEEQAELECIVLEIHNTFGEK